MSRLTCVLVIVALLLVACDSGQGGRGAPEEPAPTARPRPEPASAAPTFDRLEGFWSAERAEALLARSAPLVIEADTSSLTEAERAALAELTEVGEIMHRLYEVSRHPDAPAVAAHLASYEPTDDAERAQLDALRQLYSLFRGPIAYTLENERVPFAPVVGPAPGRNVYPRDLDREGFEAYVAAHPDQPELEAVRTVVRRRTEANLAADRAALEAHPWIEALHPSVPARLEADADDEALYAVPYALAYADELRDASGRLHRAAGLVRTEDPDLADYLEQRARDLLSNDYEAGDAAWVSGRFVHLNAELGAYETYDDRLSGQKAFFAASILVRNPEASRDLEAAVTQLAEHEEALPGGPYQTVRGQIPIGIYDVVRDYGQARGGNTASILPNEAHITRKYGRTILLRRNIMENPAVIASAQRRWRAVVAEAHADDLGPRGSFDRTVWHEVGHYLGPKTTEDGRTVTEALGRWHNHMEEMKADLVSLWLMPRLAERGVIDEARMSDAYAAGILRTLVSTEPPRDSPYRTMQLMQQNWFFEHGVLAYADGRLTIDYAAYPAAIEGLLAEVLRVQRAGDPAAAEAFVERWARWDEAVQGAMGGALEAASHRDWLVSYRP